jgi:hypothetical protein
MLECRRASPVSIPRDRLTVHWRHHENGIRCAVRKGLQTRDSAKGVTPVQQSVREAYVLLDGIPITSQVSSQPDADSPARGRHGEDPSSVNFNAG